MAPGSSSRPCRRTPSIPTRWSPRSRRRARRRPGRGRRPDRGQHLCVRAARQSRLSVALSLAEVKRPDARLVVTGCAAERYGTELADALPEADAVVGFAGEGSLVQRGPPGPQAHRGPGSARAQPARPTLAPGPTWKVAEGCDRARARFVPSRRSGGSSGRGPSTRSKPKYGRWSTAGSPRSCSWPKTFRGTDETSFMPGSLTPLPRRLDGLRATRPQVLSPAVPLPERGARPTRVDDARAADRGAVLRSLAATRVSTAVAQHEAMGER